MNHFLNWPVRGLYRVNEYQVIIVLSSQLSVSISVYIHRYIYIYIHNYDIQLFWMKSNL